MRKIRSTVPTLVFALILTLSAGTPARAAETAGTLSEGIEFLVGEATKMLGDVESGKFAVLQFVEEPVDPTQPLRQPGETAGLGIQLSQQMLQSLQDKGKMPMNRTVLYELLKNNRFKVEDLGQPEKKLRPLFGDVLRAIVYGRMRLQDGFVTVGVDVVKMGDEGQIIYYPQGRNITIAMNGDMYALCAMNGMLETNPEAEETQVAQPMVQPEAPAAPAEEETVQAAAEETADAAETAEADAPESEEVAETFETPMMIAQPLQPQAPTPPKQPYNIEIIVDSEALPCYRDHKGNFYIPAELGKAYHIRLTNNTDVKVAVALLVDGLSAIGKQRVLPTVGQKFSSTLPSVDAPSASLKFIVGAESQLVVKGWQIDDRIAREFMFVTAERSVAGEKDFWDYIGGISAAFYPVKSLAVIEDETAGADKSLPSVGTGQGRALENKVQQVAAEYDVNPAAVMGVFYEQLPVINAARMTPVK